MLLSCSARLHYPYIDRKIDSNPVLEDRFDPLLDRARRVRNQDQHQREPKVYSLHAPEVEFIGRGKARAPYEFGCKVSITTPVTSPKGGQFVLHAKALQWQSLRRPHLDPMIADWIGSPVSRSAYPRRQRLWRPQPSTPLSRLDLRSRHQPDPSRDAPPRSRGTGDRPSQG
jgi:hypothetical protein